MSIFEPVGELFPSGNETMSIQTPKGARVRFVLSRNGHDWDRENALRYLMPGLEYTVESMEVNQSNSTVRLVEFPETSFNTVLFENSEPFAEGFDWFRQGYLNDPFCAPELLAARRAEMDKATK